MPAAERLKVASRRAMDAFLLREEEAVVAARPPETTAIVARLCDSANRRANVAEQIGIESDALAALALYREAAALLVAASVCQARGARALPENIDASSEWQAFDDELPEEAKATAPSALAGARAILATRDVAAADRLTDDEQKAARADAAEVIAWLRDLVEPRTVKQLRVVRYSRVALVGLVVVGLLAGLVALWRAPRNIARGKPVSASSRYPGTPSPEGVTNGTIESSFGVHTTGEDNAWVTVDLTRSYPLREVKIVPRGDGFEHDAVPIALELSEDGLTFVEARRRTIPWRGQSDPWIIPLHGERARFVRVRRPQPGYIALAEIEVYEAK